MGEKLLGEDIHVAELAQRYRFASRLVSTAWLFLSNGSGGRAETDGNLLLSAQAFSGADLLHGPLAMIDPQVPVLTVAADGIGGRAMQQVFPRLAEQGADVFCVGTRQAVASAGSGVVLPDGVSEELSHSWRSCPSSSWPSIWLSLAGRIRTLRAACAR